jgi:cell division septum initiation protein DivIVA
VDIHDKLDELTALVEEARSMPMSASCIVNRGDVLALIDDVRELLPEEFRHAELLLQDREAVVDEGQREADRLVTEARAEADATLAAARDEAETTLAQARSQSEALVARATAEHERLVSDTEVAAAAQARAHEVVAAAEAESARLHRESDEYVESRLASLDELLERTLSTVRRGRAKLAGRADDEPVDGEAPGAVGGYEPQVDTTPPMDAAGRPGEPYDQGAVYRTDLGNFAR